MTTRYQKQQQKQQHTVGFRKSFGSQNADKSITNLFTSLNNEVYKHNVDKLYEGRLRSHARNFEVRFDYYFLLLFFILFERREGVCLAMNNEGGERSRCGLMETFDMA